MTTAVERIIDITTVQLLKDGGVDNWEGYSSALDGYIPSPDSAEDAARYLAALEAGGVDNWAWLGTALTGLTDYEEHLHTIDQAGELPSFTQWSADRAAAASVAVPAASTNTAVPQVRAPHGPTEELLLAHIAARYGAERATGIFELAVEAGIWKRGTFPTEFEAAVKVIGKGLPNPLEAAMAALYSNVLANGKLNRFLDAITSR